MGRSFLVLLLIVLVAEAALNATEPDIDDIVYQVDQFVQSFNSFKRNIYRFQGLEDVKEDIVGVTEFFDMLGDLFTNGTIGHFKKLKAGQDTFPELYINTNRTSVKLSELLVQLFRGLSLYDMFDEYWMDWLFPDDGPNELALEAMKTAFRGIFSRSIAFYDELNGATVEQIGLQYPFEEQEVDDNRCYISTLDELCSDLGWTHKASTIDYTMRSLLRIMGPGCESEITDDRFLHALQLNTYDVAKMNNFSGGESNRCFQKYFIRFYKYSPHAYENKFVTNIAVYLAYEQCTYVYQPGQHRNAEVAKHCAYGPANQEPNDNRQWPQIASNAAKQAIGNKSFEYPTSVSAVETYRATGMLMIALLKQSDGSRGLYDYKALVFYPANDDTEYCIRNGTRGDVYSAMHNNVRFLLARYDPSQLLNITEREKEAARLCAYCEVDTENQCDRLKMMPNTVDAALLKFRAVVAIKCARKFVWYELGYRYFQAAWTNAVAIPKTHPSANEYSYKCGNTVVFP